MYKGFPGLMAFGLFMDTRLISFGIGFWDIARGGKCVWRGAVFLLRARLGAVFSGVSFAKWVEQA